MFHNPDDNREDRKLVNVFRKVFLETLPIIIRLEVKGAHNRQRTQTVAYYNLFYVSGTS